MKQIVRNGLVLLALAVITACSVAPKKAVTPEEAVRARASERWQALIAGDIEKAYTYEAPEYRKVYDVKQYRHTKNGVGIWQKAEVKDVACKEECVVTMQIYVTMKSARLGDSIDMSSLLKEQWMRDVGSGEWFHLSSE